jgi:transcriptional regulator with PAS, ATPase and Fis domain
MPIINWSDELNVSITVSDNDGNILYMNNKSGTTFNKSGGKGLIGANLKECHQPESWEKILSLIRSGETNTYTIEKQGIKKLIYQTPWYSEAKLSGLVELSFEIPYEMSHFVRK